MTAQRPFKGTQSCPASDQQVSQQSSGTKPPRYQTAVLSHARMREYLRRQRVFVVLLTSYGIISIRAPLWESLSLSERRRVFLDRLVALQAFLQAVS